MERKYEHPLDRTAGSITDSPLPLYNNNRIYLMIQDMAYGPFGGVAGRDFLAVQSMDGNYLPTTSLSL